MSFDIKEDSYIEDVKIIRSKNLKTIGDFLRRCIEMKSLMNLI